MNGTNKIYESITWWKCCDSRVIGWQDSSPPHRHAPVGFGSVDSVVKNPPPTPTPDLSNLVVVLEGGGWCWGGGGQVFGEKEVPAPV